MLVKDSPQDILSSEAWLKVNQRLLEKMIAEFMYEDMIAPTLIEENTGCRYYELSLSMHTYRFHAIQRLFGNVHIVEGSVIQYVDQGWRVAGSAIQFLLDSQSTIKMKPETTGHLIKELQNTLFADAYILAHHHEKSDDLVAYDYADLEGVMTGHPWITYNKGRIGFSIDDFLCYAPEAQQRVQLNWLAVHKEKASFHATSELSYDMLIQFELDDKTRETYRLMLQQRGVHPDDYYWLPVHEWQWKNIIIPAFAEEIAIGNIYFLGVGPDAYLPQQSIRTFVNMDQKHKHHIKLPMSILNTLVYRGLPAERTVVAPEITEYIKDIMTKDAFLREECRVILPGEVASINYGHPYYERLMGAPYQYLEMLGCIWRESIYTYMEKGEQPITLAALLYVDKDGKPLVASLIEQSGVSVNAWTKQLFDVMLPPLLHYLYKYGTVFSPHGQNTILVLKDGFPCRLAIKDFVDDVNVSDQPLEELTTLSEKLRKVLRSEPPEGLCQFLFTGLFVCHYRYLADILATYYDMDESLFWRQLAETILAYQKRFPELADRFKLFDLFKPTMTKLCLNRNRMVDDGYADGDDRPHASEYGVIKNVLSQYAGK
ncbi:iron transporter [Pullulanibacillus camelliae]|uniref:Iron transporter n=1 Tax=Pullulanibacillus camelliae TaxID=1707096 RepID=A0A8J2VLQ9_9BACL|nr:IucA/IucC family siderophore biosynthesis protein [Pullulanibacillus camelliae]GGE30143.1 iron transporter [Pullulanibacillus camelliae]